VVAIVLWKCRTIGIDFTLLLTLLLPKRSLSDGKQIPRQGEASWFHVEQTLWIVNCNFAKWVGLAEQMRRLHFWVPSSHCLRAPCTHLSFYGPQHWALMAKTFRMVLFLPLLCSPPCWAALWHLVSWHVPTSRWRATCKLSSLYLQLPSAFLSLSV
jgi:hypothetical protein